jgi:hypothetical protein
MKVKEFKEILDKYDDDKQIVFYVGMRGLEDVFTYASAETKEHIWSDYDNYEEVREEYKEEKEMWDERVESGAICFDLDY